MLLYPSVEVCGMLLRFGSGCELVSDGFRGEGKATAESVCGKLQGSLGVGAKELIELVGVGVVDDLSIEELRLSNFDSSEDVDAFAVVCNAQLYGALLTVRSAGAMVEDDSDGHGLFVYVYPLLLEGVNIG